MQRQRLLSLSRTQQQPLNTSSAATLPKLQIQCTKFDGIEVECTSLCLAPSGRHVIGGFSDGTVRLFDTSGLQEEEEEEIDTVDSPEQQQENAANNQSFNTFCDKLTAMAIPNHNPQPKRNNTNQKRLNTNKHSPRPKSKGHILAQIHPRGVHTKLLTTVQIAQDGRFVFAGVLRGNVEMVACDLTLVEKYAGNGGNRKKKEKVMDLVKVHRHADAKLRGFGACVRLLKQQKDDGLRKKVCEYRLFSGKGIKNIHIWSFTCTTTSVSKVKQQQEVAWACLHSIATNGMSVTHLQFRHVYDEHDNANLKTNK